MVWLERLADKQTDADSQQDAYFPQQARGVTDC